MNMQLMMARARMNHQPSGGTSFAAYMASLSPVAWWRMNDALGSTYLNDSIGSEHATLSGSITLQTVGLVTGDTDKSVLFSGGHAATTASSKWALGTGDFSAFIIAKWTSTSFATIAYVRDGGPVNLLNGITINRLSVGDVETEGWNWSTKKIAASGSYNDGSPHVLGVSYEAATDTVSFYVDGVLAGSLVQTGSNTRPTASSMLPNIASNTGGIQTFPGTLDEYALFDKALSSTEMANLSTAVHTGST